MDPDADAVRVGASVAAIVTSESRGGVGVPVGGPGTAMMGHPPCACLAGAPPVPRRRESPRQTPGVGVGSRPGVGSGTGVGPTENVGVGVGVGVGSASEPRGTKSVGLSCDMMNPEECIQ